MYIIAHCYAIISKMNTYICRHTSKKKKYFSTSGVHSVNHLHVWSLTLDKVLLTVHITAEDYLPTLRGAQQITSFFGIEHATIQINPIPNQEDDFHEQFQLPQHCNQ
jgi:Co/Zn/Cd efflux system component